MRFFEKGDEKIKFIFTKGISIFEFLLYLVDELIFRGEVSLKTCKKMGMITTISIDRSFFRVEEVIHGFIFKVPKESGMVSKTILFNILGVAPTLDIPYDIIIFLEFKSFDAKSFLIEFFRPTENGFRKGGKWKGLFLKNK